MACVAALFRSERSPTCQAQYLTAPRVRRCSCNTPSSSLVGYPGSLSRTYMVSHVIRTTRVKAECLAPRTADHCLGLVPLLATLMSGVTNTPESLAAMKAEGTAKKVSFWTPLSGNLADPSPSQPVMNIYGAVGLRMLLRQTFALTECNLSGPYAVHELVPAGAEPSARCEAADLGVCEAVGRDLRAGEDGCWRDLLSGEIGGKGKGKESAWTVDAGPIDHRGEVALP